MKILMLTRLYSPHVGGVEKHIEKVNGELAKLGHEITILTLKHNFKLPEVEKKSGIKIVRLPYSKNKFQIWKHFYAQRSLIKEVDIIHIHDVFFWFFPFRLIYPFKPVYITCHGYEGNNPPTISSIIQRKISEIIFNGSICVGAFMKKWYYAKPDFVIYGATEKIKAVNSESKDAIYLGRLSKDAGIMIYLHTLRILKNKKVNLSLDVYGDGPQLKQAKTFVKKHKLAVKFHGFIKNAAKYIPSYKYAFVSRYLSILEAMITKKYIFAVYNNQIKKDYLTCHPQTDNIFIAKDSSILAKQILTVIKNPKLSKDKLLKSYQWARKQTWKKVAQQYLKLWKI